MPWNLLYKAKAKAVLSGVGLLTTQAIGALKWLSGTYHGLPVSAQHAIKKKMWWNFHGLIGTVFALRNAKHAGLSIFASGAKIIQKKRKNSAPEHLSHGAKKIQNCRRESQSFRRKGVCAEPVEFANHKRNLEQTKETAMDMRGHAENAPTLPNVLGEVKTARGILISFVGALGNTVRKILSIIANYGDASVFARHMESRLKYLSKLRNSKNGDAQFAIRRFLTAGHLIERSAMSLVWITITPRSRFVESYAAIAIAHWECLRTIPNVLRKQPLMCGGS